MHNEAFFFQAFVYLAAAVVSVPVAQRLGLGSVLGYLIAGVAIGPFALGLVGDKGEDVMHFAEFGVVMMLFLVGLELRPGMLWRMRTPILGTGGAQVALTMLAVTGIAMGLGLEWRAALAVGMIFSLSSTAIVLQSLNERGLMKSDAGQRAFAVLLFQDVAVIPMLALFPLLATAHHGGGGDHHGGGADTWVAGMPGWGQGLVTAAAVLGIVVVGRFFIAHFFRMIARAGLREVFTAAALLLVVGIAILMSKVGLSPALGTFLAGVGLSESEYRHELESDIEPFKGLLLGLFFIAVGASIDFALIAENPALIAALTAGLIAVKFAVLFALGRAGKMGADQNLLFAFALAQGGEFAFVLVSFALQNGVLTAEVAKPAIAVVAVSMAVTPLLFIVNQRFVQPRFGTRESGGGREADAMDEAAPVVIVGFGRFGNVVGRFLRANGVETTVLENDSDHVELLRKIGLKVFYGDASRHDLLRSAGAGKARLLILAIDDEDKSLELAETCRRHFPNLEIFARASSRNHAYRLLEHGVERFFLEQQGSSLDCGVDVMRFLGCRANAAHRAALKFKRHDIELVREQAALRGDTKTLISRTRDQIADLERRFESDRDGGDLRQADQAWDDTTMRERF